MKIVVSSCLLGKNCKYNGGSNFNENLVEFLDGHEIIPVCPEVMGGLPTPRAPAEIVNGIVTNSEGITVDAEFRAGAQAALQRALDEHADIAILQSRSPSCGVNEIYDGTFSKKKIPGKGVFATLLEQHGIRAVDLEDWEDI